MKAMLGQLQTDPKNRLFIAFFLPSILSKDFYGRQRITLGAALLGDAIFGVEHVGGCIVRCLDGLRRQKTDGSLYHTVLV